jgi:hypothetical protein
MPRKVLVVSETQVLGDMIEFLLHGSATVMWTPTPNETEGLGIDIVVLDTPHSEENLRQLRVHPHLHDVPAIVVRDAPDMIERLGPLMAEPEHPAGRTETQRATTAA